MLNRGISGADREAWHQLLQHGGRGGEIHYNFLYWEAQPERGAFFKPSVHERVLGISNVQEYERAEKSVI